MMTARSFVRAAERELAEIIGNDPTSYSAARTTIVARARAQFPESGTLREIDDAIPSSIAEFAKMRAPAPADRT